MIKSTDLEDPLGRFRAATSDEGQPRSVDDACAIANIANWREFLPADCVEAMIKGGWHRRV